MLYEEKDTNTTTYIHTGINTLGKNHFYYVVTVNSCNLESFPVDTHKTVVMKLTNRSLKADLIWNTYFGFPVNGYEVYRALNGGKSQLLSKKIPTDTSMTDQNIRCGITYTYRTS